MPRQGGRHHVGLKQAPAKKHAGKTKVEIIMDYFNEIANNSRTKYVRIIVPNGYGHSTREVRKQYQTGTDA